MLRTFLSLFAAVALAACSTSDDLDEPPVSLGNFSLGHNVVVAPYAQTSAAISREVTEEQLTTSLEAAIAQRFDRYEGEKQYHLGVSVEGYLLARAGIPVVASPKSGMIVQVTVWDDAKGKKLNEPPEQVTVLEDFDGENFFGSGWLKTADVQLDEVSENVAKAIESFLVAKNEELGWFESEEEAARRKAASEASKAAEEAEAENDAPTERVTPLDSSSGA